MKALIKAISLFLFWITFGPIRDERNQKRRRANYELLKAKIAERHFAGFAGLVVDFKLNGRKIDKVDMACFPSPMYGIVRNQNDHYCIFWDRKRLTQEIGTGAPLKDGEVMIPDTGIGRTKPSSTLETIDEQKPLTHQEAQSTSGDPAESA